MVGLDTLMPPAPMLYFRPEVRPLRVLPFVRPAESEELADNELLELFRDQPERAWDLFIHRYADLVLSTLRHLGFDRDEAMERFVYVFEKLSEDAFRRLREIRFAGTRGELVPWIRAVVRNLSVSWARSADGRRRLFKSIEVLSSRERRVFELYFWHGLTPAEILEHLRYETSHEPTFADVLDALDTVFEHLTENQRWRLASRLARHRVAVAIEQADPTTGAYFEPASVDADPEESLLKKDVAERVGRALGSLAARDRLILQLRYEETLSLTEVAEIVRVSVSTVKSSLRSSLAKLREILGKSPYGETRLHQRG